MACVMMGEAATDPFRRPPPIAVQLPFHVHGRNQEQQDTEALPLTSVENYATGSWRTAPQAPGKPVVCSGGWSPRCAEDLRMKLSSRSQPSQQAAVSGSAHTSCPGSSIPSVVIEPLRSVLHITKAQEGPAEGPLTIATPPDATLGQHQALSHSISSRLSPAADRTSHPRGGADCSRPANPAYTMMPQSQGQKRTREPCSKAGTGSSRGGPCDETRAGLAGQASQVKRARLRLPCLDQYVGLRQDLDTLLTHVAGGLPPSQGVIVAKALRELYARSNKLCFKAGLDYAPTCAISHSRLRKLEESAAELQRKGASKPSVSPRARQSPRGSPRESPRSGSPVGPDPPPPQTSPVPEEERERPATPDPTMESAAAHASESGSDEKVDCSSAGILEVGMQAAAAAALEVSQKGVTSMDVEVCALSLPEELGSSTALRIQGSLGASGLSSSTRVGELALGGLGSNVQQQSTQGAAPDKMRQLAGLASSSLVHACLFQRYGTPCDCSACQLLRPVMQHAELCEHKLDGKCQDCRGWLILSHVHALQCTAAGNCVVPLCDELRRMARARNQNESCGAHSHCC